MSALSDEVRDLAGLGAEMRQEVFGADSEGDPLQLQFDPDQDPVTCYRSAIRTQQQLDDANMKSIHDTIVRVNKCETRFQPRIGQQVKLLKAGNNGEDINLRFDEFGHSGINPEYVIGCQSLP